VSSHNDISLEAIADAYLSHHKTKRADDAWAFDEVEDMVRNHPDIALELTLLLLRKSGDDDATLAYVAAGPPEDLLKLHGPAVIGRIERESKDSSRLQLALSGVWGLRGLPVFDRWYALMRRYGFADGKRRPL
jgi:hypothetical protein